MSILTALKTSEDVEGNEVDSLGGGGFLVDTGIYDTTVELAYLSTSKGGALALNLVLATADGQKIRADGFSPFWMTSGTAKGCKNYYMEKDRKTGKETGKKKYLPGFLDANALCLLSVGKEIGDLQTEEKVIQLYDRDAGKEIPTKVDMFTELLGKEITVGVFKQVVDKTALNQATGEYEPNGETREENEINKFFRTRDRLTVPEIKAGIAEATFADQWADKFGNETINKAKGMTGTQAGVTSAPGTPAANQGNAGGQPKSLFA